MNGDLFTALDFRELVRFHESSGATATVATLEREVPIEFGVIGLDGTRIVGYDEKPTISYDVSMGVYVFEREVVDLIPSGEHFDFPDVVHVLLERGLPVAAYRSSDFWLDIGRREDYELAQERFERAPRRASPRRGTGLAMEPWVVPLSDVDVSDELAEAVRDTVASGWWSMGPKVAELEREFASLCGPLTRSQSPTGLSRSTRPWSPAAAGRETRSCCRR